ncbi:molybdopterin-dependent oxidoreductase [Alkaliphilus pronyensis]|uniref:Molybdopterin-dependent oxidoreductase n=1 Tax=Alkaliphilus pronyensis TaxID=1482732 RepID=A0A6I0F8W3_9FIRM|nr:molybdopterin cofactor-binding domain-containing protein [Alkaliphilus pronyensis]KAB3532126.1 molybdopterin-dependent oxidoreductase [Alkaliphilus pronyensis]
MDKELKYIGKRIDRPDAKDKVLGKTKYTGDMSRHGMLYGKLVISKKAHAKVRIDTTKAMAIEGVKAVFTYEDVPKKPYNSNQWYSGSVAEEDELILHETAKHVGDRIALVLGETMEAVEKGRQALIIEYDELPAVIGIEAAKKQSTIVAGETNLCFKKELTCGDVKSGFEKADFIIEDTGSTQKIHHAAIENHVCMAEVDTFGNLIIWSPCQVVFQVQHVTAQALDISYDKIRVVKSYIGGSFGGKGMPILEPICGFAALKTGRPVKIIMDRKDSIAATRTRNASIQRIKTGITKEGKIVAREIEIDFDGGAYLTNSSAIAVAAGKKAFRTYDIESQKYVGSTYYTHTTPGGACRGYGSPQVHAISEININNAAKKIGMDPVDFRIVNAVDPREYNEGAVDQIGMPAIGNARIKDCLIAGKEEFGWKERMESIKDKNTHRFAYGLGVAASAHGNGYHGSFPDYTNVTIQIMPDSRVLVKIGIHDLGCGTVLTMQQIAAEVLDISPDFINVPQADTHLSPYDSAGTQASRVTFVCGGAVKEAAELLKERMIKSYCDAFGCTQDQVWLKDGMIGSQSTEAMNYGSLATLCEDKYETTLKADLEYKSKANPSVYSAVFIEVKVDRYLGMVEIQDILVVQDAGQVINRTLAEGQVQGGAQMSLGMAICEEIIYDKKGNLKTDNFSKYHVINTPSMPLVKTLFIEKGEPLGPFGAKSIGELAAVAPAPALMNAINNPLGTNLTDYPATPERIIEALN